MLQIPGSIHPIPAGGDGTSARGLFSRPQLAVEVAQRRRRRSVGGGVGSSCSAQLTAEAWLLACEVALASAVVDG